MSNEAKALLVIVGLLELILRTIVDNSRYRASDKDYRGEQIDRIVDIIPKTVVEPERDRRFVRKHKMRSA